MSLIIKVKINHILLFIAFISLINIAYFFYSYKTRLNINCESSGMSEIANEKVKIRADGSTTYRFNTDYTGRISIKTKIDIGDKSYFLKSDISITYEREGADYYKVTPTKVLRSLADNAPDHFIENSFMIKQAYEYALTIKKVNNNTYLLGGSFSPMTICVVKPN